MKKAEGRMKNGAPAAGHSHTCALCGHVWVCEQKKCEVEKAAKVNKQGPFCDLCYHLLMARNIVRLRGQYESLGVAVAAWPLGFKCWLLPGMEKSRQEEGGTDA